MDELFCETRVFVLVFGVSNSDSRYNVVYDVTRLKGGGFPAVFLYVLAGNVARAIIDEGATHCDRFVGFVLFNYFAGFVRRGICCHYFGQDYRVILVIFSRVKVLFRPVAREMGGQHFRSTGAVVRAEGVEFAGDVDLQVTLAYRAIGCESPQVAGSRCFQAFVGYFSNDVIGDLSRGLRVVVYFRRCGLEVASKCRRAGR